MELDRDLENSHRGPDYSSSAQEFDVGEDDPVADNEFETDDSSPLSNLFRMPRIGFNTEQGVLLDELEVPSSFADYMPGLRRVKRSVQTEGIV